jgi:glycosyltransferase involved in cell wall biosynthesis
VWQHHDLFHRTGERMARALGAPLVTFVHAPQVWEAAKWGVRRPGWGRGLERLGERPALVHSDLVACVSEDVVDEVVRLGVDRRRTLVSPMAVDAGRFTPAVSGIATRERLGLADAFVVGWSGSFRGFHGLEVLLDAFARVHRAEQGTRLLLVGDGPERPAIEARAERLGIAEAVVMPGAVPFDRMPEHVAAMDVAVVVARAGEPFHYSPLKMREYLAAGRPVVAPAVGEIPQVIDDGVSGLLYEAGDAAALAEHLVELASSESDRDRLGSAGRAVILRDGTWDAQLDRVLARLGVAAGASRSTP